MKITNFVLIFFIVALPIIFFLDNGTRTLGVLMNKKSEYNRNIDTATDSAMRYLIEVADGGKVTLNLEEGSARFYNSLFASFGALDSPSLQERLQMYLPVMAVTYTDGYYIMYNEVVHDRIVQRWTPKRPYVYDGIGYTIMFTLEEEVVVRLDRDNQVYSGNYATLKEKYPKLNPETNEINLNYENLANIWDASIMSDATRFEAERRGCIITALSNDMSYYVNRHNRIAESYGIQYNFRLPVSITDTAARTVDDISLLTVFQGYPYSDGIKEVFNRFSLSGARIVKESDYYVAQDPSGIFYYHKEKCALRTGSEVPITTRKEAALTGAWSCPYCKP